MEEEGLELRHADIPQLHGSGREAEFSSLNKQLRACRICRLLKTERQFIEGGCENCPFLNIRDYRTEIHEYTTPNFTGMISVVDPDSSWATKWVHLNKRMPGCYALAITEEMPASIRDLMDRKGVRVPRGR